MFWNNSCDTKCQDHSLPIQTIAWNKICRVRCEGTLGIRKKCLCGFLAKENWKLLTQPNNISVRLRAKYLENDYYNFFPIRKSFSASKA